MHIQQHVWWSEDNLQVSVPSFHYVGIKLSQSCESCKFWELPGPCNLCKSCKLFPLLYEPLSPLQKRMLEFGRNCYPMGVVHTCNLSSPRQEDHKFESNLRPSPNIFSFFIGILCLIH